jgi:hypothetical protein
MLIHPKKEKDGADLFCYIIHQSSALEMYLSSANAGEDDKGI